MKAQKLIAQGENNRVVWRSCKDGVHTDVFETICAFLNSGGGTLLLGVQENGFVTGLSLRAVPEIIKGLIKAVGNPDIFRPAFYIHPEEEDVNGKHVIVLEIPGSPEIHMLRGQVFIRRGGQNVRVTNREELARLYVTKQGVYTERKIYPFLKESDLSEDLLSRVRELALPQEETGYWAKLEDTALLEEMNLAGKDYESGEQGLRFLAALLLGKDSTIRSIFGNTDILCEKQEGERTIRLHLETNLLDEIEKTREFLWDVLEEEDLTTFLSVVFTEREYSLPLQTKICVTEKEITAEFAAGMGRYGNPLLAKILRKLGLYRENAGLTVQMEEHICTLRMERKQKKAENKEAAELAERTKTEESEVVQPRSEQEKSAVQQTLPFVADVYAKYEDKLTPEERQGAILKMMAENDRVSVGTMVRTLQVTKRTILRDIDKLKKQKLVIREGSEKSGRWVLTDYLPLV